MERIFVRIECHVENTSGGRKDNRSFGVRGFQTRFLLPSPSPVEGEEIRGAICHPPIVCLSSTAILIPKRTNFVILGRFYFPPEADCGDAPRRQFPHISPRVHSCGNFDIPRIRCEMSGLGPLNLSATFCTRERSRIFDSR